MSEPAERLTVAEVTGGPVFTLTNDASIVTRLESGESVLGVVQLSNGFFLLLIQRSVQDVEMRLIDPAGAQRRVFALPTDPAGNTLGGDLNLTVYADTVVIAGSWDRRPEKVAWKVTLDSTYIEAATMPASWGRVFGATADGTLIVLSDPVRGSNTRYVLSVGRQGWSSAGPFDGPVDTLLVLTTNVDPSTGASPLWSHEFAGAIAVGDRWVAVAPDSSAGFRIIRLDASSDIDVSWESGDRSVPDGALDAWIASRMATSYADEPPERREALSAQMRALPVSRQYPAIAQIRAATGEIYVRPFELMDFPRAANLWLTFDADGKLLRRIESPFPVRPLVFGESAMIGTRPEEPAAIRSFPLR